jgi:UDP:flavonoid glycosyltransferase YjiC (YdhE family)
VFPALALARELRARGHEVSVESLERWREVIEGLDLAFEPAPEYVAFPFQWPGMPAEPTLAQVVEELKPRLERFRPDVVVNDFFTLPPVLAAESLGIRRATLVPHVYPASEPGMPRFLLGRRPPRTPLGSLAWRLASPWVDRRPVRERGELNEVRAELGLPPLERFYGGLSDQLVMVATFPQLEYPRSWPEHVAVTGPMFFELPHPPTELPAGDAPLVLVAGSTAQDQELELVRVALEALADEPVRVLAAMNQRGRVWQGPVPDNARVVDWVSYSEVIPQSALVLCNGGHGTVARALAAGVPVLVCPSDGDMRENGMRADWAGLGRMLARRRMRVEPLRGMVRRMLADRRLAERATAVSAWSAGHDGAGQGATLVERLARS